MALEFRAVVNVNCAALARSLGSCRDALGFSPVSLLERKQPTAVGRPAFAEWIERPRPRGAA